MKNKVTILAILIISCTVLAKEKPKLMWFDAEANWQRFCHKDSITYYLDKVKKLGFTDVVIDIKPITGEVLYNSNIAPQMKEWNKVERDPKFNYLQYFIDEGHKRKLKVRASANTFVAGHNFFDRGVIYTDKDKSYWQSINYTDSGLVKISLLKHKYSTMLNPALKEVQDYEISIFKEIAKLYPKLDGIILDRVRYDCIEADFSNASKELFEKYTGKKVSKFPEDIFSWAKDSAGTKIKVEGPLYKQWLEWRVSVIYNFIKRAKDEVKK
ncbi:MAG: family 10 glycosylhydrolase, partial [Bacteroidota bacterium]|nr:family 10 glycosylhydrolase [Bacteroidota bacterium]